MSEPLSIASLFPNKPLTLVVPHEPSSRKDDMRAIVGELMYYGAWGLTLYLSYWAVDALLKEFNEGGDGKELKKSLAKRLNRPEIETMSFDKYEQRLMVDVIGPDEIDVTFESIGGMDDELEEVKDNIVLPFQIAKHYKNYEGISSCPTGVLLYGAPGTGKSLTAKAIARESGATFISIKASSVMDKWFGESDRLVSALFRLGRKLAPSVIFIDEIETLLKKRNAGENNSGMHSMQGSFLSEWDGLASSSIADAPPQSPGTVHESAVIKREQRERQAPVIVLGATNRPMDLDKAFLRRMPVQIQTKVPNMQGRVAILKAQLAKEQLDDDVDLMSLALRTDSFTGSDIRELVRVATLRRMKSYMESARKGLQYATEVSRKTGVAIKAEIQELPSRPLSSADFEYALNKTVSAADNTREYGEAMEDNEYFEKYEKQLAAIEKVAVAYKK